MQAVERRRSDRGPAVPNRALLEWRAGNETKVSKASFINISDHGALLACDACPLPGARVMIRLREPVRSDWAGAMIVRRDRLNRLAVDFPYGCPGDLRLAAFLGLDVIGDILGLDRSERYSNSGD